MESAVLTGAVSTLSALSAGALPRGRFSTGCEQLARALPSAR